MAKKSKDNHFMGLALLSAVAVIAIVALVLFLNGQMTGNAARVYGDFGVYDASYVTPIDAYAQREYGVQSVSYYERTQQAKAKSAVTERSEPYSRTLQTTYN